MIKSLYCAETSLEVDTSWKNRAFNFEIECDYVLGREVYLSAATRKGLTQKGD